MFRSEAFRLLNPRAQKAENETIEELRLAVNSAKEVMCAHFAKLFLSQAELLTASEFNETMLKHLHGIMMSAAEISEKLHVQRSRLVIAGMPHLPDKFDSSSPGMEAHMAHVAEIDDDEKCLDGKNILIVVHPEVTAIGSSDGSDTSKIRVLKKAVVWMGMP
jgi:predicted XRE-type DNA-binding protein